MVYVLAWFDEYDAGITYCVSKGFPSVIDFVNFMKNECPPNWDLISYHLDTYGQRKDYLVKL